MQEFLEGGVCFGSVEVEPAADRILRQCVIRSSSNCAWDFGYPLVDKGERYSPAWLALVIVFPRGR
jgi:hypothetical protein